MTKNQKWGEVANPSDKISICIDDEPAAWLAVLAVGDGKMMLDNEEGEQILPFFGFGGDIESEFQERYNIGAIEAFPKNRIVAASKSAQYGSPSEIIKINQVLDGLPDDEKTKRMEVYQEGKRTSMFKIVDCFHGLKFKDK